MKLIKLTRGLFAQVDDSDYDWLIEWKWCALKVKHTYYAVRVVWPSKKMLLMHRVIMNTPEGVLTDHQDHNGLNCQRYNMRNATHSQNRMNSNPKGRSKYLGVSYDGNRPIAQIWTNGKKIHLGSFLTEVAAALAYNKAAIKYHGEFANLNVCD